MSRDSWMDSVEDIGDGMDEHIQALEDRVDELVEENKKLKQQLKVTDKNIDYKESYERVLANFHALLEETLPF